MVREFRMTFGAASSIGSTERMSPGRVVTEERDSDSPLPSPQWKFKAEHFRWNHRMECPAACFASRCQYELVSKAVDNPPPISWDRDVPALRRVVRIRHCNDLREGNAGP